MVTRFVDANVFIYQIDGNPEFGATAKRILKRIEEGEEAVTSTLVLEEVFVHVEQEYGRREIPRVFRVIMSYGELVVAEYTLADMDRGVELLEELQHGADWDDSVIAATMERLGVREIYSNDSHFDRFKHIRRVFS